VRTYCGTHCDLLLSLGAVAGTRTVIHSCSSLSIIVPCSLPPPDWITGTGISNCPGMSAVGQGLTGEALGEGLGEGLGVEDCAHAGKACNTTSAPTANAALSHDAASTRVSLRVCSIVFGLSGEA